MMTVTCDICDTQFPMHETRIDDAGRIVCPECDKRATDRDLHRIADDGCPHHDE